MTNEELHELQQELFNEVYRGLASQGFLQSLAPGSTACRYRGDDGAKCAAGHLIPDEAYDEFAMECHIVSELDYFTSKYPQEAIELVRLLQTAHDGVEGYVYEPDLTCVELFPSAYDYIDGASLMTPELMKRNLGLTAMYYGLTVPNAGE
jgi:hypothetical protein